MHFISWRWLKAICIVMLSVIVFACASSPTQKKPKKEKPPKSEQEQRKVKGNSQETDFSDFVATPNPYEKSKKSVPGQAKKDFSRVQVAMQNRRWSEAKNSLDSMIVKFPKLSGPYVNLGIVHKKLNEIEEAENAFKFAIEKNQHNFDAYSQLGLLYREEGRFAEAEATYLKALELWPHHFDSNKNIGILYDLYMGKFDKALYHYELSLKITGGNDRELKGWIADLKRRMAANR